MAIRVIAGVNRRPFALDQTRHRTRLPPRRSTTRLADLFAFQPAALVELVDEREVGRAGAAQDRVELVVGGTDVVAATDRVEEIAPGAAVDEVVAAATENRIGASEPVELVMALPAAQDVGQVRADNGVVAVAAVERDLAHERAGDDGIEDPQVVVTVVPPDDDAGEIVHVERAHEVVDRDAHVVAADAPDRDVLPAPRAVDGEEAVDDGDLAGRGSVFPVEQGVVADATVHRVVAAAAVERVVAP